MSRDLASPWRLIFTRSMDALHRQCRLAGFFGDKPVLFFDDGARGSIAVEPAENVAGNSAIGSLRPVFVDHVEQDESFSRCRLSCHGPSPSGGGAPQTAGDALKPPGRCLRPWFPSSRRRLEVWTNALYRPIPVDINPLASAVHDGDSSIPYWSKCELPAGCAQPGCSTRRIQNKRATPASRRRAI